MARPTVSDLARAAGVSITTVSHAFSGRRHVDPETRARIEQLAREMGYRPNHAAQRLRTGRTGAIALASSMPFAVAAGPSRLGFLMEIAASAAMAALHRKLALCLIPPLGKNDRLDAIAVDGAILVEPACNDPLVAFFDDRHVPIVSIGRAPGRDDIPFVDLHSEATASMILFHLEEQGARRVALVTGLQRRTSYLETEASYAAFSKARGYPPVLLQLDEAGGEEVAERACAKLLTAAPELDALFVPVDAFATGALKAARAVGRPVPQTLRLVTRYDGLRAKLADPPLTAVNLNLDRLAEIAVDLLIAMIEGGNPQNPESPIPVLVPRCSSWLRAPNLVR